MVRWAPRLTALMTVAVSAGCGGDDTAELDLDPVNTDPIRPSAIAVTTTDASITDVLSVRLLDDFGPTGRDLADLLLPPAALGEFTVLDVAVDDPNDNGRIDGRWYPPRIKRENCSTSIDAAPSPIAAASYVPGRPTDTYAGQPGSVANLVDIDEIVTIRINLFDEPTQRDEMFTVLHEMYASGFEVDCTGLGQQELVDVTSLPSLDGHPDSIVFEVQQLGFDGLLAIAPVGDRVLVTVGVGEGFGGGGGATPDRSDLEAVASAQIDRVGASTLP